MSDDTTTWTLPNGTTVTWTWDWTPKDPPDDDDPLAGVREPRRPKPSPSSAMAHAG